MEEKKVKSPKRKWIIIFWGVYVLAILGIGLFFLLADKGAFGAMPTFEQLENPETNLATEVFSADGETIGKYYQENRTPIAYEDLSENLINALVATEDIRYYDHSGIDAKGTIRAFVFLGKKGGASTISQQLAKQLFHGEGSRNRITRLIQKMKEWIIAIRLERNFTKQEIIAMYYNVYDFSNNADGIRSASRIYFGKEPIDLEVEEAAVLAGMFKNSALYNPLRNPQGVINRRNVVLKQMEKAKFITTAEKDSLQSMELELDYQPESHQSGTATYFRGYLQEFMKTWTKENPKPDGSSYNIYRDGLKIYTTLDVRMQKYAEEAVAEHMKNLQTAFDKELKRNKTAPFSDITEDEIERIINRDVKNSPRYKKFKEQGVAEDKILASFQKEREMQVFAWNDKQYIDTIMTPMDSIYYYKSFLSTGMMSMNPQTGEIKAWVGGINFKHFKFDHVKQGKRQVGSTFKPFVYATAIDQLHYSPCKELPNSPFTIPEGRYHLDEDWSPKNSGDNYGGMVTLKKALANSYNVVTARLIDRTGPQPVIDLLEKLGMDTKGIPAAPAIALGTVDFSVYEMVSAYSTFANKGVYVQPFFITTITDKNGTVLYQNKPVTRDVINEESAYVTMKLLQGVTEAGTGIRLRYTGNKNDPFFKSTVTGYPYDFKNPIAGKTGTTQNQSDGWFMGIVPNLTTGVWVGGDNRSIHFDNMRYGQGATMALPIWGTYMKKLYADETLDVSQGDFEEPEHLSIEVDCDKFKDDEDADSTPDKTLEDLLLN